MLNSTTKKEIKLSFQRVKAHMEALEAEIKANRDFIISQNKQIELQNNNIHSLNTQIKSQNDLISAQNDRIEAQNAQILDFLTNFKKSEEIKKKTPILTPQIPETAPIPQNSDFSTNSPQSDDSKGNKGVSLDGYSLPGYSLPGYSLPGYSLDIHSFKQDLPIIFGRLSRQEFMTFLTIYQQEEEGIQVTYETIAKDLKITAGCVRTYVSGLIKKDIPVIKAKYNNKIIVLKIPQEVRSLNLKKNIIQLFYNLDPSQKKLFDQF